MKLQRTFGRLFCLFSLFFIARHLEAQTKTPDRFAEEYKAAAAAFFQHTGETGIFHDGSAGAHTAHDEMWSSAGLYIASLRLQNPTATIPELQHALCLLVETDPPTATFQDTPDQQCAQRRDEHTILDLAPAAPDTLVIAPAHDQVGTVMIVGQLNGQPVILWSIADASDNTHQITAWSFAHSDERCRDNDALFKLSSCGPLQAGLLDLNSDASGRARFAVLGSYAQEAGATFGAQTTIWQWDGKTAKLLWVDVHLVMADDPSDSVEGDVLVVRSKGNFKTMFDCGACDSRPMEHRILLEANGVRDLGIRSTVPELDVLDTFFDRLAKNYPVATLASPAVIGRFAGKIPHDLGMITAPPVVQLRTGGATVCLVTDALEETYDFTLTRELNGGYFIASVRPHASLDGTCAQTAWSVTFPKR